MKTEAQMSIASRAQLIEVLAKIGELERANEKDELALNTDVTGIKHRYAVQVATRTEQLAPLYEAVRVYCEANRATLCPPGRKSVDLKVATVAWRSGTVTVEIADEAALIEALKKRKEFRHLVKSTETIDKRTLLACRSELDGKIAGLRFVEGNESVEIKPNREKAA